MKTLFLLVFQALLLTVSYDASAQLNVNINVGAQPSWGPAGYDHVDYYYLPDVQTYYHVPSRKFIYLNDRRSWIYSDALPSRYRDYNLYKGYKVVINSPRPYMDFDRHKVKYAKYKFNNSQPARSRGNGAKHYKVKGRSEYLIRRDYNPGQGNRMHRKAKFNGPGNGHFKDKGHGKR